MIIRGIVVKGRQLGRKLGFPTANIIPPADLRAEPGVWVAKAKVGGNAHGELAFATSRTDRQCEGKRVADVVDGRSNGADSGRSYGAVANFGVRPSADNGEMLLEVHLFGFEGDLYGREMEIELLQRLRPEQKFATLDRLRDQIARDAQQAKEILTLIKE